MKRLLTVSASAIALAVLGFAALSQAPRPADASGSDKSAVVERGRYLVTIMGCADCHTPLKMGANGPEPDMSMMLAGHPEKLDASQAPALQQPWMAAMTSTMTGFAGPWGISYAANLTPDKETGLGQWTEEEFVAMANSMRHRGRGRPILPPMPVQVLQHLTPEDLHAMYSYLQSIPAIHNKVPDPKMAPQDH